MHYIKYIPIRLTRCLSSLLGRLLIPLINEFCFRTKKLGTPPTADLKIDFTLLCHFLYNSSNKNGNKFNNNVLFLISPYSIYCIVSYFTFVYRFWFYSLSPRYHSLRQIQRQKEMTQNQNLCNSMHLRLSFSALSASMPSSLDVDLSPNDGDVHAIFLLMKPSQAQCSIHNKIQNTIKKRHELYNSTNNRIQITMQRIHTMEFL